MTRPVPVPVAVDEPGLPRPLLQGMPIPYSGDEDQHGIPDSHRLDQCVKNDLCGVCGEKLLKRRYVAIGIKVGDVLDQVGMHERCAKLSLAHCPHMSSGYSHVVWINRDEYKGGKHFLTKRQVESRRLKLASTADAPDLKDAWRPANEDWPSWDDHVQQQASNRIQPVLDAYAKAAGLDPIAADPLKVAASLIADVLAHTELDYSAAGVLTAAVRAYLTPHGEDKQPAKTHVQQILREAAKAA